MDRTTAYRAIDALLREWSSKPETELALAASHEPASRSLDTPSGPLRLTLHVEPRSDGPGFRLKAVAESLSSFRLERIEESTLVGASPVGEGPV